MNQSSTTLVAKLATQASNFPFFNRYWLIPWQLLSSLEKGYLSCEVFIHSTSVKSAKGLAKQIEHHHLAPNSVGP